MIFDVGSGHCEHLTAELELDGASAIGEQSEVTNTLAALRESVQEKAGDELVGSESHQALLVSVAVVLPCEGDEAVFELEQAMV